jgi:hypothetical protein
LCLHASCYELLFTTHTLTHTYSHPYTHTHVLTPIHTHTQRYLNDEEVVVARKSRPRVGIFKEPPHTQNSHTTHGRGTNPLTPHSAHAHASSYRPRTHTHTHSGPGNGFLELTTSARAPITAISPPLHAHTHTHVRIAASDTDKKTKSNKKPARPHSARVVRGSSNPTPSRQHVSTHTHTAKPKRTVIRPTSARIVRRDANHPSPPSSSAPRTQRHAHSTHTLHPSHSHTSSSHVPPPQHSPTLTDNRAPLHSWVSELGDARKLRVSRCSG